MIRPKLANRILVMHKMHGKEEGVRCGDCVHFRGITYSRTYWKCDLTNMSHGASTDWRSMWPACGKFERREGDRKKH